MVVGILVHRPRLVHRLQRKLGSSQSKHLLSSMTAKIAVSELMLACPVANATGRVASVASLPG